jgi:hypothetical protein
MEHRGGGERKAAKAERHGGQRFAAEQPRFERKAERKAEKVERKAERRFDKAERRVEHAQRDWSDERTRREGRRGGGWIAPAAVGASLDGCPPGLARKDNGCLPPGQAKKRFALGERVQLQSFGGYNVPVGYRDLYADNQLYNFRYDDSGYIYRVDRQSNLVSGLIPLLGGGFGIGQPLPAGYDLYNVPMQYRDLYHDSPEAEYRYGDNAIYQVDPQSGIIESIVALLAGGDGLGIGQALPGGFDAYNLPLQYRDEYQDSDDSIYRYADGNIYQADAKTQIIEAIISALT